MSMHKKPLTPIEAAGLGLHGLPIGKPSQLSDVFRSGLAYGQAAEREACEQDIRSEPELTGEIPQAMFDAVRHDKDACAEALRILVRVTKSEILARIAKRSNVRGETEPTA